MNCDNECGVDASGFYTNVTLDKLVNLAEPKERLIFTDKATPATDFDLSVVRGLTPLEVSPEDLEELQVLAGRKEHNVIPFIAYSGDLDGLIAERKKNPMRATEEELDDLAVLSGVRERTSEEQFIDELEDKLNYLMGEVRSVVRILKNLLKERREHGQGR